MKVLKNLRLNAIHVREPLFGFMAGLGFTLLLLFFRLGTLVPGISATESRTLSDSSSWQKLIDNPINFPYKFIEFGLIKWGRTGALELRSISAIFALGMICLFFYTLRRWYARRTAILGTALLVSSSWLLHFGRLAQPDILYSSLIAVLAYGTWLKNTKKSGLAVVVGGILAAILMYIPGLIWFVVIGGWWQRKIIFKYYAIRSLSGFLFIFITSLLLMPLIYGVVLNPEHIKSLLGLQLVGFPNIIDVLQNALNIPYQVFVHASFDPSTWLGQLPLLDIFAIVMLMLGTYAYYFLRDLDRARVMVGILGISTILISLHGGVSIIILLPFLYVLISAGIALLLQQWLTVFPRNPLAGLIGTVLVSLTVALSIYYNVNHYFIAWPNNPDTKKSFVVHEAR